METIIQGLHSCKPGNEPVIGETKTFTVEQKIGKSGKAYLKIKSASAEHGGTPYRILEAEPTGFTDKYQNISFNLGIESAVKGGDASCQPTSHQETNRAGSNAAQQVQTPSAATELPYGPKYPATDGIQETREHLMRSANLLVLCIRAVEKAVAPHQPVVAQTSEQFQSDVGKLFIEASGRRTSDGVNWWSYIDRMPVKPLSQTKNGGNERNEDLTQYSGPQSYQPEPF